MDLTGPKNTSAQQPQSQTSTKKETPSDKPCKVCGEPIAAEWWPGFSATGRWVWDDVCKKCEEKSRRAEIRRREEERAAKDRAGWIGALGGLRALEEYTLDRFIPAGFKIPEGFPEKEKSNLYIHGAAGSGKTHLAVALARAVAKHPGEVLKTNPINIFRDVRASEGAQGEIDAIKSYIGRKILIIDDIGVSKDTDFSFQTLYEIIDGRYSAMSGGLIFTSNLSLNDLAVKLNDDRLTSRIAGMCKIIKTTGPDRRLPEKAKPC